MTVVGFATGKWLLKGSNDEKVMVMIILMLDLENDHPRSYTNSIL